MVSSVTIYGWLLVFVNIINSWEHVVNILGNDACFNIQAALEKYSY